MLQIYQKKLKFTVDVRSLPSCTVDDRTVRLMALSGPRAWTDREPFLFEDAVAYDDQFEMKEVNSLWPNFFVGINGGNWMVLDGVLKSESQVDAPIVRYGQGDAMAQTLVAWCTGGEGAPLHPNPYRPEVLVIFSAAGVLTFEGVVRVFNTTADDSYDYTGTISTQDQHRIVANIKSEGDVYTGSVEGQIRAAGELVGQLTMATHLDRVRPMFSGLVKTGGGAMVATATGKLYSWSNTLAAWTIAPYYDGGVVHVMTSEFLQVTVPGEQAGGSGSALQPVVDAIEGVSTALSGGDAPAPAAAVLEVNVTSFYLTDDEVILNGAIAFPSQGSGTDREAITNYEMTAGGEPYVVQTHGLETELVALVGATYDDQQHLVTIQNGGEPAHVIVYNDMEEEVELTVSFIDHVIGISCLIL